jgi:Uma2 family endonuclease
MAPRFKEFHPPGRPAAMSDIEALPGNVKGEVIDGVLYTQPRPRSVHADIATYLASDLKGPYQRGRGGPGGWWILLEPGIQMPDSPEVAPDLAGWRKERMPRLPVRRSIDVVPDWVCEVLSPGTRGYDLRIKRPFYARVGVAHLWYVDPEARTLTVSQLRDGHWVELGVHGESDVVRAEPFGDVAIELADWWPPESAEDL